MLKPLSILNSAPPVGSQNEVCTSPVGSQHVDAGQWAKLVFGVHLDPRLSLTAKVVYNELVRWQTGAVARRASARIARVLGVRQARVLEALADLVEAGHLEREKRKGRRSAQGYRLTSAVFRKKTEAVVEEPVEKKPAVAATGVECAVCHKKRRGLPKTLICRTCTSEQKTARIARRVAHEVVDSRLVSQEEGAA